MENQAFFSDANAGQAKPEALPFDFKRVFFRAIRYWYVVVISLILAVSWAYLTNRYAVPIYPIAASILIKGSEEAGGAELLYNNALINQSRNYLDEPYILRSFPLIRSVVEDLNYDITFFREGRLTTSDAYDFVPVTATLERKKEIVPIRATFTIISPNQFTLRPAVESKNNKTETFNFGDTIVFYGDKLVFNKKTSNDHEYINVPFLLVIHNINSITAGYVGKIGVGWAEQGSGVINLTINGPNVYREIDFLNGLINRYQLNDLNKKNQKMVNTIDFISNEIRNLSDSMRVVESRLQEFKNIGQASDVGEHVSKLLERLELIEKDKADFLIKENYYDYLAEYLNNNSNLDQIIVPSSMGINDGVVTDLIQRLEKMEFDIKLGREFKKEGNPLLQDQQIRISTIKRDIQEAIKTLRATDRIKLNLATKQLKTIENQLAELPATERQYVSVKRNYSLMENLYIFLMQKLSEAKISRASNASDIIVVNSPKVTGGFIYPKVSQNYSIALILGILLPFLMFATAEFFNDKIQSKEDIDKISTIPFIGGIGHNKGASNLIVQDKPKSSIAESFRALRSNLNYFTSNQDKKVFLVSSSISGEGKTFTTLNLATVLAMSGKKTMIIGADMRKPKLYGDFGLNNEKGLSNFLSGLSPLEDIIQTTNYSNLFLISGGPVPPNPSELLMTRRMTELMKALSEQFDYIVIDTPPIALVTDAFVLSKYADHSIFLVRQNFTPKTLLKNVEDFYRSGRLKNISVLLNDIYKTGPGYGYAYHYGYGYGYGNKKKNAAYYDEGGKK